MNDALSQVDERRLGRNHRIALMIPIPPLVLVQYLMVQPEFIAQTVLMFCLIVVALFLLTGAIWLSLWVPGTLVLIRWLQTDVGLGEATSLGDVFLTLTILLYLASCFRYGEAIRLARAYQIDELIGDRPIRHRSSTDNSR